MTETEQDIPIDRSDKYVAGDTAVLTVAVSLDDSTDTDLTGSDIAFALASYPGADPLVEKTLGDGIELVNAGDGQLAVTIDPADTQGLGDSGGEDYYYEVTVRDSKGDVATVTTGTWTIHADTASI